MVNATEKFIIQTAKDYDMEPEQVKKIFDETKNYLTLYDDLELFIKNRAGKNESPI